MSLRFAIKRRQQFLFHAIARFEARVRHKEKEKLALLQRGADGIVPAIAGLQVLVVEHFKLRRLGERGEMSAESVDMRAVAMRIRYKNVSQPCLCPGRDHLSNLQSCRDGHVENVVFNSIFNGTS